MYMSVHTSTVAGGSRVGEDTDGRLISPQEHRGRYKLLIMSTWECIIFSYRSRINVHFHVIIIISCV